MYIESYIAIVLLIALGIGYIVYKYAETMRHRRNVRRSLRTIQNWY